MQPPQHPSLTKINIWNLWTSTQFFCTHIFLYLHVSYPSMPARRCSPPPSQSSSAQNINLKNLKINFAVPAQRCRLSQIQSGKNITLKFKQFNIYMLGESSFKQNMMVKMRMRLVMLRAMLVVGAQSQWSVGSWAAWAQGTACWSHHQIPLLWVDLYFFLYEPWAQPGECRLVTPWPPCAHKILINL